MNVRHTGRQSSQNQQLRRITTAQLPASALFHSCAPLRLRSNENKYHWGKRYIGSDCGSEKVVSLAPLIRLVLAERWILGYGLPVHPFCIQILGNILVNSKARDIAVPFLLHLVTICQ